MTRKDYEKIAFAISCAKPMSSMAPEWRAGCRSAQERIASALMQALAQDNPSFDRVRFLKACGLND